MKLRPAYLPSLIFLLLAAITSRGQEAPRPDVISSTPAPGTRNPAEFHMKLFDETYEFIFLATLEGLYRDGVSQDDVDALLVTKDGGGYLNFIYTCPICMPVESALLTYKQRAQIDRMKPESYQNIERTFGFGLPADVSTALHSAKTRERLNAVNALVAGWISYRMDHSGLTKAQKTELIANFKKGREKGMKALRGFAGDPRELNAFAPGYSGDDECAICNAALQMPLKLKKQPESHP